MRTLIIAAAAAAASLALAVPALADGEATAQPTVLNQTTAADQNRLICRVMTHEGMVLRKAMCLTREQWELAGYKARQQLADFQMRHYSH